MISGPIFADKKQRGIFFLPRLLPTRRIFGSFGLLSVFLSILCATGDNK